MMFNFIKCKRDLIKATHLQRSVTHEATNRASKKFKNSKIVGNEVPNGLS